MLQKVTFFRKTSLLYKIKSRVLTNNVLVSYTKIMTKFDDFLIMSPQKMDDLAKKYYKQLNSCNKETGFYKIEKSKHFEILIKNIDCMQNTIANMSQLCSTGFYNTRAQSISKVQEILASINPTIQNCDTLPAKNFCMAVTNCISCVGDSLMLCLSIMNEKLHDKDYNRMIEICNKLSILCIKFSNLIGECRYRYK